MRWRGIGRPGTYAVPLLLVILFAFDMPVLFMLSQSVLSPAPTSEHWAELAASPIYLRVLGSTFKIALIVSVVCALAGYPLAFWIRCMRPPGRALALVLVLLPFWISVLVRTYAWIVMLGNAGLVNRTLLAIGLIESPIAFLYNSIGVTIGTANILLPYLVLPLLAAMLKLDDRLFQVAATLGASPRAIFWRVFLPLTAPAYMAGMVLVIILTLGFFVTPAILGGGRVPMIASLLDMLINTLPKSEVAAAISTLLLGTTLLLFSFYRAMAKR